MKTINKIFENTSELEQKLNLDGYDPRHTVLQVFTSYVLKEEVEAIRVILNHKNPDLSFIGTTTAGEIFNGEALSNKIVVSAMIFERTTFSQAHIVGDNDFELGVTLVEELVDEQTKAVIMFVEGLSTNSNDVIDGVSSINSSIPLAGGMAGDMGHLSETFIFDDKGTYTDGVVALALRGENLQVATEYSLNWRPIGSVMTVTKSEKNKLYELDHIPILDIYNKYLGEEVGARLPYSAIEFPLIKQDADEIEVCRAFISINDDSSVNIIGNLNVGDELRFAYGSPPMIMQAAKEANYFSDFSPEAIFTYSCASRITFLQADIVHELRPLAKIAPTAGFFTYGEIFHRNNTNVLLNVSLTMLALSENDDRKVKNTLEKSNTDDEKTETNNLFTDKHYLVLDALTNLSETIIQELEETNQALLGIQQKLKDQARRDHLTNLYNRRYFFELAENIISASARQNTNFSLIAIDVDKFKKINDTYGHGIGDRVLTIIADLILRNIRDVDIIARFGGEEFVLMLPFTDTQGAVETAERLRNEFQNFSVPVDGDKAVHFTASFGICNFSVSEDVSLEEVINNADCALYQAKKTGRNKVVCYKS